MQAPSRAWPAFLREIPRPGDAKRGSIARGPKAEAREQEGVQAGDERLGLRGEPRRAVETRAPVERVDADRVARGVDFAGDVVEEDKGKVAARPSTPSCPLPARTSWKGSRSMALHRFDCDKNIRTSQRENSLPSITKTIQEEKNDNLVDNLIS